MKIKSNKIKCNHCGSVIESKYTHDFVWCPCHKVAVDGGKEYLKRTFGKISDYTELSDVDKSEEAIIIAKSKQRRAEKRRLVKKQMQKQVEDSKANNAKMKKDKADKVIKEIIGKKNPNGGLDAKLKTVLKGDELNDPAKIAKVSSNLNATISNLIDAKKGKK